MSGPPHANTDRLLASLDERFGDAVRSCVEYTPNTSKIHYLRDDIEVERHQAETRLIRVRELYHAERLSAVPLVDDSELGQLCVSFHLFEGALVVHFVDASGRVFGVSLEPSALPELLSVGTEGFEALYGTVPERLEHARESSEE